MADIGALKPNDTVTFNLRHPVTDDVLDCKWTVHGKYSKRYKAALHKVRNTRMKAKKAATSEQIEKNTVSMLAACVESWENMVHNGEEKECNLENAVFFLNEYDWIFSQVDEEVDRDSNFLPSVEMS